LSRGSHEPHNSLEALATRAGEHWASACADDLRRQGRAVNGAWPGTLTEARAHMVAALAGGVGTVSIDELRALSRTAYGAARAAWRLVADPDEEQ
jgi:hypothetical protein